MDLFLATAVTLISLWDSFVCVSSQGPVPVNDLFIGGGKVVILHPDVGLNITQVKAILVYIKNLNPVYVQMWRKNSDQNYTLDWQVELRNMPIFGQNLVNLGDDDVFPVSPDHRLGLYNLRDPGPVPYRVTDHGTAVLSQTSFPNDAPPIVNDAHLFTSLNFPYMFGITICNYTDCLSSEPSAIAPTTASTKVTTSTTTPIPVAGPGGTEHPLMSGTFLVVLLVWLIVLTFIVITVIIVIIYLNARSSGAITRAADDKTSNAEPEGDWYIVVQDTTQAQKVLSS